MTCLGNAYNYSGRLDDARDVLGKAIKIARQDKNLSLATFSYGSLGEVYRDQGRFFEAYQTYQQLLDFSEEVTGEVDNPLTGFAQFEIGVVMREWYDLDNAIDRLVKGVALCREWLQGETLGIGLMELAETHRLRGEFQQAKEALEEAYPVAVGISPWAIDLVKAFVARLDISKDDLDAAARWAEHANLDDESGEIGFERFPECLPLIRLYNKTGQALRALALIEKLMKRDRAFGRMGRVPDLLALKVAALHTLDEEEQAVQTLSEAVEITANQKHIRPFLDEAQIHIRYLKKIPPSPHRERLLTVLNGYISQSPEGAQSLPPFVEPLNEREVSILRLLASYKSNREIADAMYLSVNTVRWYNSQIYTKLGVSSRGSAVARARELGII